MNILEKVLRILFVPFMVPLLLGTLTLYSLLILPIFLPLWWTHGIADMTGKTKVASQCRDIMLVMSAPFKVLEEGL